MKNQFKKLGSLVALSAFCVSAVHAAGYVLIDLGKNYFPYAVNTNSNFSNFRVAGTFIPGSTVAAPTPEDITVGVNWQAFYWINTGGTKVTVPLPTNVQGMISRGINASHRLVGSTREPVQGPTGAWSNGPFAYTFDTTTSSYLNLQPVSDDAPSWAHGINNSGTILCNAINNPSPVIEGGYTTNLTKARTVRNTPYVATPQMQSAMAINQWDAVVGQINPDPWTTETSQMWISHTPTTWTKLGVLPNPGGISKSYAYALNSVAWPSTTIAGYKEKINGSTVLTEAAYYQSVLATVPLSSLSSVWSRAYGVNKHLTLQHVKVVGSYKLASGDQRAFVYQVGLSAATDCNTYLTVAQRLKWKLIAAYAINDYDVIVGYGLYNDGVNPAEYRGFVLRPN